MSCVKEEESSSSFRLSGHSYGETNISVCFAIEITS